MIHKKMLGKSPNSVFAVGTLPRFYSDMDVLLVASSADAGPSVNVKYFSTEQFFRSGSLWNPLNFHESGLSCRSY
jgi:hypothetical protein